ncbi:MAG TPA: YceI family protein [Gemmatimonadaceae bacterium]|jgi:polyisoprenoid-binding protein YceI|nr:YceI family protein [Gemmatimonadaceae bacterium]
MAADRWNIDPAHTNIEFSVRHLMISTVKGRFADFAGTIVADESNLSNVSVDVTIQTASVDTRQPDRDTHLKSPDFFDVGKFPTLVFKGGQIKGDINGDFHLTGSLTIRGVTKPITLDVTHEGRGKDPWGGERLGFSAKAKVNRKDFGLAWNQTLETGGVVVGDEVKISVDVELVKVPAEQKVAAAV